MIKQFTCEAFCLECRGCCRFSQEDSVWLPYLLKEEEGALLKAKGVGSISYQKIYPVRSKNEDGFLCPFLGVSRNKCGIYLQRPFECQLYPFLLNSSQGRVYLAQDPHCPYLKEKEGSNELKEYIDCLIAFINSPAQLKIIQNNLKIIHEYPGVENIAKLDMVI
ncbi:MAG: YkgJ family cysteine cluster protein [Candidatus Omnitrophota bacterium]